LDPVPTAPAANSPPSPPVLELVNDDEPRMERILGLECAPLPSNLPAHVEKYGTPFGSIHINAIRNVAITIAWIVALGLLFGGALLTTILVKSVLNSNTQTAPMFICSSTFAVMGAMLAAIIVPAVYLFNPKRTLWLCPKGLVWRISRRIDGCHWDELVAFRVKMVHAVAYMATPIFITIKTSESTYCDWQVITPKQTFWFDTRNIGLAASLFGNEIERILYEVVKPRFERWLAEDREVECRPFTLTRDRLIMGKQRAAWDEVSYITVDAGFVTIHLHDRQVFAKLQYGDLSHAQIFLELAERFISAHQTPRRRSENPFEF
jgi:hypothetical protein